MTLRRRRLWDVAGAGLALALLLGCFGVQVGTARPAFAATSQFHGVNWADPNDNFITGPNIPVGLSQSDSYSTTYTKATTILKGFQSLGANTVRFGINAATTSSTWWSSYTAAFDAATALGMNVVICALAARRHGQRHDVLLPDVGHRHQQVRRQQQLLLRHHERAVRDELHPADEPRGQPGWPATPASPAAG